MMTPRAIRVASAVANAVVTTVVIVAIAVAAGTCAGDAGPKEKPVRATIHPIYEDTVRGVTCYGYGPNDLAGFKCLRTRP